MNHPIFPKWSAQRVDAVSAKRFSPKGSALGSTLSVPSDFPRRGPLWGRHCQYQGIFTEGVPYVSRSSQHPLRIGLIVPSSNTTMETEIPALLRRREQMAPERFTFHSSRMAMKRVSAEELARMDAESDRCAR